MADSLQPCLPVVQHQHLALFGVVFAIDASVLDPARLFCVESSSSTNRVGVVFAVRTCETGA
jgi:hypothetical protein